VFIFLILISKIFAISTQKYLKNLELVLALGPSGAVFTTAGANNDDLTNSSPCIWESHLLFISRTWNASSAVNEYGLGNFDFSFLVVQQLFGLPDIATHVDFFIYTATGRMNESFRYCW
jgi:hypothetical protein